MTKTNKNCLKTCQTEGMIMKSYFAKTARIVGPAAMLTSAFLVSAPSYAEQHGLNFASKALVQLEQHGLNKVSPSEQQGLNSSTKASVPWAQDGLNNVT